MENSTKRRRQGDIFLCAAIAAVAASSFSSGAVLAQEEGATKLDAIEVTGSRIKRAESEGPLPVTVITRQDIELSGDVSVSDYLRNLTFNSFGSFNAQSGFAGGAQGGASLSLRGVGEERTLVLVDGRRFPNSPAFAGAAQNLNVIPLAAIERIEILREGASAIYGSDAIGGVVNIITRRDFSGVEISGQLERPSQEGGDGAYSSLVAGLSTDKGNVYFTADHFQRDIIFSRDRPYTADGVSTLGSPGSLRRRNPAGGFIGTWEPFANCPADFGTDPNNPNSGTLDFGASGVFCGFNFAAVAAETSAVTRDTVSVNGNYQISSFAEGFARLTATRSESFGRFAPAPGIFNRLIERGNPNNPTRGEDGCDDPNTPEQEGCQLDIRFRFVPLGNRDNTVNDDVRQTLVGVRGDLDILGASTWEVAAFDNRYTQNGVGTGYGRVSNFFQAVADEVFNPFAPTDAGNAAVAHTTVDNNLFVSRGFDGQLSFGSLLSGGFRLPLVVGGEYREERFRTQSDAPSSQSVVLDGNGNITDFVGSDVFGSAGGSAQGSRNYYGIYTETALGMFDDILELGFALRYDSYSDAGSKTSPKVSVAVRPFSAMLARASYSRGFRAPDLESLFGAPAQSFPFSVDTTGCLANGGTPSETNTFECRSNQRETLIASNPTLKPETSENYSAGLVVNVLDDLSLSLDYYNIQIDDGIANLTAQRVIDNENAARLAGRSVDPFREGLVVRSIPGDFTSEIGFIFRPALNLARIETDGIDFNALYRFGTPVGKFGVNGQLSWVNSFKQETAPGTGLLETVESAFIPEYRAIVELNWQLASFHANIAMNYIDKTKDCTVAQLNAGNEACQDKISSWTTWDLQAGWQTPWNGELVVGARNLFDRDPPLDRDGDYDFTLHNIAGRVPYVKFTQRF